MAEIPNSDREVSEFQLQLYLHVHFSIDTLWKRTNVICNVIERLIEIEIEFKWINKYLKK